MWFPRKRAKLAEDHCVTCHTKASPGFKPTKVPVTLTEAVLEEWQWEGKKGPRKQGKSNLKEVCYEVEMG